MTISGASGRGGNTPAQSTTEFTQLNEINKKLRTLNETLCCVKNSISTTSLELPYVSCDGFTSYIEASIVAENDTDTFHNQGITLNDPTHSDTGNDHGVDFTTISNAEASISTVITTAAITTQPFNVVVSNLDNTPTHCTVTVRIYSSDIVFLSKVNFLLKRFIDTDSDTYYPFSAVISNPTNSLNVRICNLDTLLDEVGAILDVINVTHNNNVRTMVVDTGTATFTQHSVTIAVIAGSADIAVEGSDTFSGAPAGYFETWEATTSPAHTITVTGLSSGTIVVVNTFD